MVEKQKDDGDTDQPLVKRGVDRNVLFTRPADS
jgi:hypothetical protein